MTSLQRQPDVGLQGWPTLLAAATAQAIITVAFALGACTVLPALVGSTPFVITSGSMGPLLRAGDVLVIKPLPVGDLRAGQIVVVTDPARPGRRVAHRIARLNHDDTVTLRGDANPVDDSTPAPVDHILGAGHLVVPMIGLPVAWASSGRSDLLAGAALIATLTLYLAVRPLATWAPRRGRTSGQPHRRDPPPGAHHLTRKFHRRASLRMGRSAVTPTLWLLLLATSVALVGAGTTVLLASRAAAGFAGTTTSAGNSLSAGYFAFDAATIETWAGTGTGGYNGEGTPATAQRVYQPSQMALDSAGNLYLADSSNHRVRKITPGGTISTIAGTGTAGYSGDGGAATSAELNHPRGVVVDASGNVYFSDADNNRIRMIAPSGIISRIAGTGTAGYSGDGGAATYAQLKKPRGMALDAFGNLYVVDSDNYRVRKFTPGGTITTVAGTGTPGSTGEAGPATNATISLAYDIAVDGSGCLYLADTNNNRIRRFCVGGNISTVAGNGTAGFSGDNGPAISANLTGPSGVAVDTSGVLYICDRLNNRVRKVTPAGVITTLAGNGAFTSTGDGGLAKSATVKGPRSVVTAGNRLYVSEQDGERVRRLTG